MLEFQEEEFGLYSEGSEERQESFEQQKSRTRCECWKEPLGGSGEQEADAVG